MGDYADMAVDAGIDEYWQRDFNGEGDDGEPSIGFPRFRRRAPTLKTCNRCGQTGLFWSRDEGDNWRLHDTETARPFEPVLHVCGPNSKATGGAA